jgi:hypothetical protein
MGPGILATPIISAIWEAQVGGSQFEIGPSKNGGPYLKLTKMRRAGGLAQVLQHFLASTRP